MLGYGWGKIEFLAAVNGSTLAHKAFCIETQDTIIVQMGITVHTSYIVMKMSEKLKSRLLFNLCTSDQSLCKVSRDCQIDSSGKSYKNCQTVRQLQGK